MNNLEYKIAIAIKFIKRYKKNIRFIEKRIVIQNEKGYNPWLRTTVQGYGKKDFFMEKQYGAFDADEMKKKLNIVKLKLEKL